MEQTGASFTSPTDVAEIVKSIGVAEADLIANLPPVIGNTGNSFLLIGVDDEKKLSSIEIAALQTICKRLPSGYLFRNGLYKLQI